MSASIFVAYVSAATVPTPVVVKTASSDPIPAAIFAAESDIEYEISSPSQDIVTNNQMELTAIINAIEFLFEENIVSTQSIPSNVIIYSDSNYAVRGINEWIERWILSQQKTGNTRPNWDLWSRLYVLKNKLNSFYKLFFD